MTKYYKENYPRPQFVRDSYLDLNGEWNFRFDDGDEGLSAGWKNGFESRKILVPFSYECTDSGIGCTEVHEIVWYSRKTSGSTAFLSETTRGDTQDFPLILRRHWRMEKELL